MTDDGGKDCDFIFNDGGLADKILEAAKHGDPEVSLLASLSVASSFAFVSGMKIEDFKRIAGEFLATAYSQDSPAEFLTTKSGLN